ncbi:cytoplasmic protein [Mesotoga sp. UBA6090]|uniref:cytoplasmic protein n=1 Tax=Mesotoga sp. UBA6090 TaxID=1946860 RepID=UPI0025CE5494|nr:cytoplasmic protein [Mesotoga sp. UBA6090]
MERVTVTIEASMESTVDNFLLMRHRDVEYLNEALVTDDFERMMDIAKDLNKEGRCCGFDFISSVGTKLFAAASEKNKLAAEICVDLFSWYMTRIRTEVFGE